MTNDVYEIMKELVDLHEQRNKIVEKIDELEKKLIDTGYFKKDKNSEHYELKDEDDEAITKETDTDNIGMSKIVLDKDFLRKLYEYGYYKIENLKFDFVKRRFFDNNAVNLNEIYKRINHSGTLSNWSDLYDALCILNVTVIYDENEMNINFNSRYYNDSYRRIELTTEQLEKYGIKSKITYNSLRRKGIVTLLDLALVKDIKKVRGIGPGTAKKLKEAFSNQSKKIEQDDYWEDPYKETYDKIPVVTKYPNNNL